MTSPDRRVHDLHAALVETRPLVHCLTNVVAARFSADALLAVGASPAMIEDAEETAEIGPGAGEGRDLGGVAAHGGRAGGDLGAVMGAFLAAARRTGDDAVTALAVASAVVGATGAAAARASAGPGTFVPAWLDLPADPDLDAAAGLLS